jgi:hypothetical protein
MNSRNPRHAPRAPIAAAAFLATPLAPAAARTSPGASSMYAYVGSFTTLLRKARGDTSDARRRVMIS